MHGLIAAFRAHFLQANQGHTNEKEPAAGPFFMCFLIENCLEFFEEVARRAGDIHSARSTALTILDALDDAGGFGALRTIGALVGIHDLLTVAGLGNLRHNACSP